MNDIGAIEQQPLDSLQPRKIFDPLAPAAAPTVVVGDGPVGFKVAEQPGEHFYAEQKPAARQYLSAIYADTAVYHACVLCHNEHQDSPRSDCKLGEVMGGVVIRKPID